MAYGFCTLPARDPRGMDSHVEIKSHTSGKSDKKEQPNKLLVRVFSL